MGPKKKDKEKSKLEESVNPDQSEVVPGDTDNDTVPTTESKKMRGKRSVSVSYKVVVRKSLGKKYKVRTNSSGRIIGEPRVKLQSYIGILARTMVPINIRDWRQVNPDLKNKLWFDIKEAFDVKDDIKGDALKSAGIKWRGFKTYLTRNYVLRKRCDKKRLKRPPNQYAYVGREEWKEFVNQRCSDDWTIVSKNARDRVSKRKYHHRLSRKGYAGLEEEMELPDGTVVDRAILWKKARESRDGKIDKEVETVVTKIDKLLELKEKGELEISGSNDVLTQALEKPEHAGRVRGVGGFVSPRYYFQLPKQTRIRVTKADLMEREKEHKEQLESMQATLAMMEKRLAKFEENERKVFSPKSEEGSNMGVLKAGITEVGECVILPSDPSAEKEVTCELAIKHIDNIVAFGRVLETSNVLEAGCIRVLLDGCIKADAPLYFPLDDVNKTVGQAVGNTVTWPDEFVIRKSSTENKKKNAVGKKTVKEPLVVPDHVPKRFNLLYRYAKIDMMEKGITIGTELESACFGVERDLRIFHEDVIQVLEYQRIGAATISAYMANWYETLSTNGETNLFAFIEPGTTTVSHLSSRDFVPFMVQRLKKINPDLTVVFVPHNPGEHWILAVIVNGDVYILDSLAKLTRYALFEKVLTNVVKTYNFTMGNAKNPVVKYLPGCPKQTGGKECGYYVMRYMKEIIQDDTMSFMTRWAAKSRGSYTEAEILEVRDEVADYFQSLAI